MQFLPLGGEHRKDPNLLHILPVQGEFYVLFYDIHHILIETY